MCFGVAGSEEETKNEMVAIFPNPTAALLHIMVENEAVGKVDLVVMDAIGRQVGFFKGFEKNIIIKFAIFIKKNFIYLPHQKQYLVFLLL